MKRIIAAGIGTAFALALAGCGGNSELAAEPAPTVTETVTVTATPTPDAAEVQAEDDAEWLAYALESRVNAMDMRDILVANDFDCPNESPLNDLGILLDCEAEDHTTVIVKSMEPRDPQDLGELAETGSAGIVSTEWFTVMSDHSGNIEIAETVLASFEPFVQKP